MVQELEPELRETPEEALEKTTGAKFGALVSPEAVIMLPIAGLLDLATIVCAFLTFFFGIGSVLSKIIYAVGLAIIGGWALFRSGSLPIKKGAGRGRLTEIAKERLGNFFKKHWKKLGAKLIPLFGDIVPYWTWTVYKELTS